MTRQATSQSAALPNWQSTICAAVRHLVRPPQPVGHACTRDIFLLDLDVNLDSRLRLHLPLSTTLARELLNLLLAMAQYLVLLIFLVLFPGSTPCVVFAESERYPTKPWLRGVLLPGAMRFYFLHPQRSAVPPLGAPSLPWSWWTCLLLVCS